MGKLILSPFKPLLFALGILTLAGAGCDLLGDQAPPAGAFSELKTAAGSHRSRPYRFIYKETSSQDLQWVVTDSWRYNHGDADQKDWNKLCGFSFHLFTSHKNSAMVAWRWHFEETALGDGWVELAPYFHVDGQTIKKDGQHQDMKIARAIPGGDIKTRITPGERSVKVEITTATDTVVFIQPYQIETNRSVRWIWPWFGGNKPAPHDIYYLVQSLNQK